MRAILPRPFHILHLQTAQRINRDSGRHCHRGKTFPAKMHCTGMAFCRQYRAQQREIQTQSRGLLQLFRVVAGSRTQRDIRSLKAGGKLRARQLHSVSTHFLSQLDVFINQYSRA